MMNCADEYRDTDAVYQDDDLINDMVTNIISIYIFIFHSLCLSTHTYMHCTNAYMYIQVTSQVVQRKSFIASVIHSHLPQREKIYDFTYNYEITNSDFTLAKPSLRPSWQGLYYPLSNEVWLCILFVLLLTPFLATLVSPGHR